MVGLADQQAAVPDGGLYLRGDIAQVGGQDDPALLSGEDIAHAPRRVVGGGEGLGPQAAQLHPGPGLHDPQQAGGFAAGVPVVQTAAGGAGGVDGGSGPLAEHPQAGDMVAVLMGDENGGQFSGCDTQGGQTGSDLFG